MSDPASELQFTDEEIDHAVRVLVAETPGGEWKAAETVRAVLRAVRAVPARCLNGHATGQPAARGTKVQGTGTNGRIVRGTVEASYPVTTTVRTPEGDTDYLWTNTIASWDPSTDELAQQLGVGRVVLDPSVPPGQAWIIPERHRGRLHDLEPIIGPPVATKARITISADQPETIEPAGPSTPATLQGSPLGLMSGKVVLVGDTGDYLRADDDGMPCEADR